MPTSCATAGHLWPYRIMMRSLSCGDAVHSEFVADDHASLRRQRPPRTARPCALLDLASGLRWFVSMDPPHASFGCIHTCHRAGDLVSYVASLVARSTRRRTVSVASVAPCQTVSGIEALDGALRRRRRFVAADFAGLGSSRDSIGLGFVWNVRENGIRLRVRIYAPAGGRQLVPPRPAPVADSNGAIRLVSSDARISFRTSLRTEQELRDYRIRSRRPCRLVEIAKGFEVKPALRS